MHHCSAQNPKQWPKSQRGFLALVERGEIIVALDKIQTTALVWIIATGQSGGAVELCRETLRQLHSEVQSKYSAAETLTWAVCTHCAALACKAARAGCGFNGLVQELRSENCISRDGPVATWAQKPCVTSAGKEHIGSVLAKAA